MSSGRQSSYSYCKDEFSSRWGWSSERWVLALRILILRSFDYQAQALPPTRLEQHSTALTSISAYSPISSTS